MDIDICNNLLIMNDNLDLSNNFNLNTIDICNNIIDTNTIYTTSNANTNTIYTTSNANTNYKYNVSNNINALTLEYFSKTGLYTKNVNKQELEHITYSDKKFYKKRILNATRQMLKNEFENDSLKDVFNKYIFSLIAHFKILDTYEIIQKNNFDNSMSIIENMNEINEYENILTDDISCISIVDISLSDPNELLFKKDTKILTMDNFIHKKQFKKENISFPLKKNINLREPEFKTKGIHKKIKKENIDNV
jgi:hypothetical protein